MTTVVDVAQRAGVSAATVSRVLNGLATVGPEIRDRVHEAMQALGYRPNLMAQGLRKGQSSTVALLVGDIAQRHFAELTLRVQAALGEGGLDLMLFNLGHSERRLDEFLRRAGSMRLRGIVLSFADHLPESALPQLKALQDGGITVVSLGQDMTRQGIASVVHEERAAMQRSVGHLLSLGHRDIAYIGRIQGSAVGEERFKGYQAAMRKAGLYRKERVFDRAYRYAAGHSAVMHAHETGVRFTAVQTGSDEIAAGAMTALADIGLRVPQDVAVIGCGDVEMSRYLRPRLTTLSTHPDEAAMHLSRIFESTAPVPPELKLLRRQLVLRDTT